MAGLGENKYAGIHFAATAHIQKTVFAPSLGPRLKLFASPGWSPSLPGFG